MSIRYQLDESLFWDRLYSIKNSHSEENWHQTEHALRLLGAFASHRGLPPFIRSTILFDLAELLSTRGGMYNSMISVQFARRGQEYLHGTQESTLLNKLISTEAHALHLLNFNKLANKIFQKSLHLQIIEQIDQSVMAETLIRSSQNLGRIGNHLQAQATLHTVILKARELESSRLLFYARLRLADSYLTTKQPNECLIHLMAASQQLDNDLNLESEKSIMRLLINRVYIGYLLEFENDIVRAAELLFHNQTLSARYNYSFRIIRSPDLNKLMPIVMQ